jgi:hypothetical protein
MIGEDEQDPKGGGREMGRYEREVEASFPDRTADGSAHEPDHQPAARRRKAALGWLLFLAVIIVLAIVCWPRLELLMRHKAQPTAPPAQAGSAAPAAAAQQRPKRSTYDYPPCTATRTDRCVQQGGK